MTKQPFQFDNHTQSLIKSKKVSKKESKILNPEKMEANDTNQTDHQHEMITYITAMLSMGLH